MIKKYLKQLKDAPVIYVNPTDIVSKHSLNKDKFTTDGNWDTLGDTIYSGFIYNAFEARLDGAEWEDTEFFKRQSGLGKRWLNKLPLWDLMLDDIVNNGYNQRKNRNKIDEYISILIGRNGHMFIYNGIHRLVCCLLSDEVDKIPVKVLLRHSEWEKFKDSCIDYANRRNGLYAQLPHPDLESIPFNHSNNRAELVADASNFPNGSVLDIGAHWGTTSYVLAQKGFNVTAVEKSKNHFNKLKKISMFPGKSFTAKHQDFTIEPLATNTLVMLNIAHHFIIDKVKRNRFMNWLNDSSFAEIFYQAHGEDSKWAPYMTPEEMLNKIMDTSGMKEYSMLKDFNGRKLYHLT